MPGACRQPPALPAEPRKAFEHLAAVDPRMPAVIARVGSLGLKKRTAGLHLLCSSIIGQSISIQAAEKIVGRFSEAFAPAESLEPAMLLSATVEEIRSIGLTTTKAQAIQGAARLWEERGWSPEVVRRLPDDELARALTSVRGIGPWTVTMFLIFGLRRPDVLPWGDLGLRVGMQEIYGLAERPDRATVERLAAPWAPWRTVGTVLVWRWLLLKSNVDLDTANSWW